MNANCYKIVFSKRLGTLVAVGEHTASTGKAASGQGTRCTLAAVALALACMTIGNAQAQSPLSATALPTSATVNAGKATLSTNGANMAISQTSDKASINWGTFNIGSSAAVNITQPNANAVLLNRVTGNGPSQIFGKLSANGQVILLNPNGIVFGQSGSVTASTFTASTFGLSDDDFMAGYYKYNRNSSTASVVNQGTIETTAGGYVALIGASVTNEGKIIAPQGDVVLAAAESVTLPEALVKPQAPATPNTISVRMSKRVRLELDPATVNTAVNNTSSGVIMTEGGQVLLQAAAISTAVASVTHSGKIDTSAPQAGAVTLLSENGNIKVDGSIKANSNSNSNDAPNQTRKGGDIIIGRDEETGALAKATDVSGAQLESTNGFVETSGEWLASTGTKVQAKEWLLDPNNIEINSVNTALTAGNSVVLTGDIQNALALGTSVSISTGVGAGSVSSSTGVTQATAGTGNSSTGTITVNNTITSSYTGANAPLLKLTAASNIAVNAAINTSGSDIFITSKGGAISNTASISARNISIENTGGTIDAATGAITKGSSVGTTGAAGLNIQGNITASNNLNLYGLTTNDTGINQGAYTLSGANIQAVGKSGSTFGIKFLANSQITTTGTSGDSLVVGYGASTSGVGGSGVVAMTGGNVFRAASGTTLTINGQATTVAADTNTSTRGIRIDGTVDTYGTVSLIGNSGSSDGFLLQAGSINVRTGSLNITGTLTANGGGWRPGVNISQPIWLYNNTSISIVGKASNSGAMTAGQSEWGVSTGGLGTIKEAAGQIAGDISITGYSDSRQNSEGVLLNGALTTSGGNIKVIGQTLAGETGAGIRASSTAMTATNGDITIQSIGNHILLTNGSLTAKNITIDNTGAGQTSLIADTTGGQSLSIGTVMGGSIDATTGTITAGSGLRAAAGSAAAVSLAGTHSLTATGNINIQGNTATTGNVGINTASTASITSSGTAKQIKLQSNNAIVNAAPIKVTGATGTGSSIGLISTNAGISGAGAIGDITNKNASITFGNGGNDTYSGTIYASTFNKSGAGTETITGSITSAVNTDISGGTLSIGNGGSTGTLTSNTATLSNNATLAYNRSVSTTIATHISGTGNVSATLTGALSNLTADHTIALTNGTISLVTDGSLAVTQALSTTNTSSTAAFLEAGKATAAGTASGGDISFSGSGSLTVGNGGRATLMTGSIAGSTGLGILGDHSRFSSDETTTAYTAALGSGIYAIYRESTSVTATVNNASKTYDGQTYSGGYTFSYSGLINNDTHAQLGSLVFGGTSQTALNFGTYGITATGNSGYGYNMSFNSGQLSINKANLVLSGSRAYDGTTSTAGATLIATGVTVGGATQSFAVTGAGDTSNLSSKNASLTPQTLSTLTGLSLGTASNGADANNYNFVTTGSTYSINKANIVLSGGRDYDGTTTVAGSTLSATGVTVGGITESFAVAGAGNATNLSSKNASITPQTLNSISGLSLGAGSNGADANNYNFVTTGSSYTVTAKEVVLSVSKEYDGVTTLSGNQLSITTGVGTETLTYSGATTHSKNVVDNATNYVDAITLGNGTNGGLANNYKLPIITSAAAGKNTVAISSAALTLTANSDINSKTYNGTEQSVSGFTITGGSLKGTDNANTVLTGITAGGKGTNAGTYSSIVNDAAYTNGNYAITKVDGSLIIAKKEVALSVIKEYDGVTTLSGNQLSIATGVGTETLTYSGATTHSKNVVDNATNYVDAITLGNGTNGGLANNYKLPIITSAAAGKNTVAISSAALTLTANSDNKTYNGSEQSITGFTITNGSLKGSDTITVDLASISVDGKGTNSGAYTTAVNDSAYTHGNYVITKVGGSLVIAPKEVALIASKTYDGSNTLTGSQLSIVTGVGTETLNFSNATLHSSQIADNAINYVDAITLLDGSNGGKASNYMFTAARSSNNTAVLITQQTPEYSKDNKKPPQQPFVRPAQPVLPNNTESASSDSSNSAGNPYIVIPKPRSENNERCDLYTAPSRAALLTPDGIDGCLCETEHARGIDGLAICYEPKKTANNQPARRSKI
jgi:filamentous hemagglutinin family protein